MRLSAISIGYSIYDLPPEFSAFFPLLVTALQKKYANDRVLVCLSASNASNAILIQKLEGSILVLSEHWLSWCEGFLFGCAANQRER